VKSDAGLEPVGNGGRGILQRATHLQLAKRVKMLPAILAAIRDWLGAVAQPGSWLRSGSALPARAIGETL
jgi:hypothetical protein